jgi:hypothetical protein
MTTINQLDPSQENVLKQLIFSQDKENNISIVYGPPGTGKSHLIVSLLFELAIRKKKVLFVSQNTEALEVIERMINKLEHELLDIKKVGTDENNISLTDFCFMLDKQKYRTKKYIRESYNKLSLKAFPSFDENKTNLPNDESPYKVAYVNLDKETNDNIDISQELGFDELLFNYLKNVKTDDIPSVPVKNLEKINLRKIFQYFTSYPDSKNLFSDNNKPFNVLRFFSKTNFDITLPKIHSTVDELINLFSALETEKLNYSVLKNNSIINILSAYKKIFKINTLINIKRVWDDKINVNDLFQQSEAAIEISNRIEKTDMVEHINLIKDEIFTELDITILNNREVIRKCNADIKKASLAINSIIDTDLKASRNIENALFLCIESIGSEFFTQVKFVNQRFFEYSFKKLEELFKAATEWDNRNLLYQIFAPYPKIFFDKRKTISPKKFIKNEKTFLEKISNILQATNYTINNLLNFYSKRTPTAYIPLQHHTLDQKIKILNQILIVYEISIEYKIKDLDCLNIEKLSELFEKFDNDFSNYNSIVSKNISLAGQYSELITLINKNIRNIKNSNTLFPIINKYAKYLYSVESRQDFIYKARNIKYKEELLTIINTFDIDSPIQEISENKINEIINILEKTKLFSDDFFNVNLKENVNDWIERIKNIMNFADINAFNSFLNQNKFLHVISQELGENKNQLIDNFLDNNDITYNDFIKKITNDLVKAKFNNTDASIRKNISDDYLIKYRKSLKNIRKNYFLNGLNNIYENTMIARKKLKFEANWLPGKTQISRLQQNTKLIINAFPIVVATSKGVSKYVLAEKELFDFIVFDEASQLLPGQALPCIYRAKKAIVVGDPHQMPPPLLAGIGHDGCKNTNDDEEINNTQSILDLAIELQTQSEHYLQVHYRSESNMLFEPSIKAIYQEYGVHSIFESGSNPKAPINIQDNLGNNDEKNFDIIIKEIKDIIVITPKASFCLLFTNKETLSTFEDYAAKKNVFSDEILPYEQVLISTVTNCQGIENDHSIIYLNHYSNIGAMWFFKKSAGAYKRLNVSITRQRKSLKIFMANPKCDWLSTCDRIISDTYEDKDRIKSARLLQSVIEKVKYNVNEQYIDDLLKDNESKIDSPLTQELYNKLVLNYKERLNKDMRVYCEVGWLMRVPDKANLQRYKNHAGFRLDIGIYSLNKKCFVLGIEMDGTTYHKGHKRAFCDAQRQETLEAKGWQVYRIWSTNWINNMDYEFKKLTDKINESL